MVLKDAPRRKNDLRVFEAVFQFHLYLYLVCRGNPLWLPLRKCAIIARQDGAYLANNAIKLSYIHNKYIVYYAELTTRQFSGTPENYNSPSIVCQNEQN
jgi:hypothetical protein